MDTLTTFDQAVKKDMSGKATLDCPSPPRYPSCVRKTEIERAYRDGCKWVGWGAQKGCPVRYVVHECHEHPKVVVGSVDELTSWLDKNAVASTDCWQSVLDRGLAIDQTVWSAAYSARRHADRAMRLLSLGHYVDALFCAKQARDLGTSVADGFDPWDAFHAAVVEVWAAWQRY